MKELNFKVDEDFYYRYKYAALDRRMSLIGLMRASVEAYLAETAGTSRPEENLPLKKRSGRSARCVQRLARPSGEEWLDGWSFAVSTCEAIPRRPEKVSPPPR